MTQYLSYITDSIGQNYLGIKIHSDIISGFLKDLKDILGDDYETYISNQQTRDRGSYHITVINVMDYNALSKKIGMSEFVNSLELVLKYPIDDLTLLGVGSASRNENTTYFVVCRSEKLNAIRKRYNLPEFDFHITIGFKYKDVFGVRKNKILEKKSKFKQFLNNEYNKKDNLIFLKKIENYDENIDTEIIPISITDTLLKVKVGNYILNIGLLEDENKLWVVSKYKDEQNLKRMPTTELINFIQTKN